MHSRELQSPGTGPFFGRQTLDFGKSSAENMDLSPSRQDFPVLLAMHWATLTYLPVMVESTLVLTNQISYHSFPAVGILSSI